MTAPLVLDALAALADPVRGRLLVALERHELAVGELAAVLQLPQSTVSRHLKTLVDAGWVASRADGPSRRYRFAPEAREGDARRLWAAVREPLRALPSAAHDESRLRAVVAERRAATRAFFSGAAHAWDRLRVELFGARADLIALLALLDDRMTVGDLGCGTGAVADLLAPFVGRVVAVDHSREMLDVARRRLDGRTNVELREGDLEALPVADGELDAALLVLTLHHMPDPEAVFAEAARTLRPGGRLVVIDMAPHDREGYRAEMGHVWLGFGEAQLAPWLRAAGFGPARYALLPADPAARGPALFAAAAALARAAGTPPAPEALGACRPDADSLGSTAPPDAPAPDAAPRTQTLITVP
jgi:ArsR family transcriptional regulator